MLSGMSVTAGSQAPPAPNELTPVELAAWRGLLRVHAALVRTLDAELDEAHALPLTHYDVLIYLRSAPGRRLRMAELADSVLLSRSGVTRLVDRLERDGLLVRDTCDSDGRGCFAVLTERGRSCSRAPGRPTWAACASASCATSPRRSWRCSPTAGTACSPAPPTSRPPAPR